MLTFPGNISFSERISELKRNSSKANHLEGRILAHSLFYPAPSESSLLLPLTSGELNPWCWPFTPHFCLSSFVSQAPQAWHTQSHYCGISFPLAQELHVSENTNYAFETAESLPCRHLQVWCEDQHLDVV